MKYHTPPPGGGGVYEEQMKCRLLTPLIFMEALLIASGDVPDYMLRIFRYPCKMIHVYVFYLVPTAVGLGEPR